MALARGVDGMAGPASTASATTAVTASLAASNGFGHGSSSVGGLWSGKHDGELKLEMFNPVTIFLRLLQTTLLVTQRGIANAGRPVAREVDRTSYNALKPKEHAGNR